MKTKLKLCMMFLAILCASNFAHGQGTAFTYTGRLNNGGVPANGAYDLRFTIYDANAAGGVIAGPLTFSPVDVANGLFTVRIDFGDGVFTGPPRWLNIEVQPTAGGGFMSLTPRQEVTSSPYAIRAATAGTATDVANGSVVKSLNSLKDNVTLAAGANVTITPSGNTLTLSSAGAGGSGIWSVLNNNAYYTAGNVGIGTANPLESLTIAGVSSFNTGLKVTGNASGGTGIALENTSSGGHKFDFLSGGVGDGVGVGAFGIFDETIGSYRLSITPNGNVGIGTATPLAGIRLDVNGAARMTPGGSGGEIQFGTPSGETGMAIIGANRADVRFDGSTLKLLAGIGPGAMPSVNGITIDTLGNVGVGKAINFGSTTRQMFNMFGTGFGIGVQTADLYYRSGGGFAWHVGGVHNDATYNSGGGTTVATLDLTTGLDFGSRLGQHLTLWGGVGARRFDIGMQASTIYFRTGNGVGDAFAWYKGGVHSDNQRNAGGGQSLMTLDGETGLFVAGPANVCTLTIRGGCDLAEPFLVKEEEIEKGSVVVIDKEHPGQLKRSTQAYDKRVAGIVSGANGINSGISLHQEDALEGGQNVALSGRVYVLADAGNGEIEPGDLLTTSDTPGHAMKVADPVKAQGAILGKAMGGLKNGRGMVLVLVTLQ